MSMYWVFFGIAVMFTSLSIWLALLFLILGSINASGLMWVLFWIYATVSMASPICLAFSLMSHDDAFYYRMRRAKREESST